MKVYGGKKTDEIVKALHPGRLRRGSLVSPSLETVVINAKYMSMWCCLLNTEIYSNIDKMQGEFKMKI